MSALHWTEADAWDVYEVCSSFARGSIPASRAVVAVAMVSVECTTSGHGPGLCAREYDAAHMSAIAETTSSPGVVPPVSCAPAHNGAQRRWEV